MKKSALLVVCVLSALSLNAVSLAAHANDRPTILPSERPGSQTWNKASVYNKGDSVRYVGRLWVAKWWTQGDRPQRNNESGPWKLIRLNGNDNNYDDNDYNNNDYTKPNSFKVTRYREGFKYSVGDRVRMPNGNVYRCRNWPATPWCELAGYAPGKTQHWRDAWSRVK
ncbi:carbohydrate-binding protein [Photobacterium carnosum]|uniref:carbohydrate-binding protein n=1 Tax=Photobacterium carnosum TaxID=2023717 RepID=UPI001E6104ED|nr:carbohydrate-binding protein [Photobacterium carnosum]